MKVIAQTDLKKVRGEMKQADPRDELIGELARQVAALNVEVKKLKGAVQDV